jgi:hypothetical protein
MLTFYLDIPEPSFVLGILQDVCCASFALWAMTALHVSILMQKTIGLAGPRGTAVRRSTVTGRLEIANYFSNITSRFAWRRREDKFAEGATASTAHPLMS